MTEDCTTCRFSAPAVMPGDGAVVLECRRYPPTVVPVDGQPMQVRPQVESGVWCGEFRQVEDGT